MIACRRTLTAAVRARRSADAHAGPAPDVVSPGRVVSESLPSSFGGSHVQAQQGESITVGALAVRFLVDADATGGSVTVFECHVPAGARMPAAHSHDAFEETVYGLDGVATFTVDGEQIEIGPGDAVCIRRGVVHGFENRGSADVKFLAVASPGVFGPAYFRDIGAVLAAGAGGPPDQVAIAEVMRRHGLTPAPPVTA
jgi:quercetin dioxygenase-like cupin family protein